MCDLKVIPLGCLTDKTLSINILDINLTSQ